jgi:cytochrome c-type biogenesis protein CcmH/NrfG
VTFGWAPLVGVYLGNFKLVEGPKPELYSLPTDPFEQANLYEKRPRLTAKLRDKLSLLYGSDLTGLEQTQPNFKPSAGDIEKLAALGYVGATGEIPDVQSRPNPKDMMPALNRAELAADPRRPVAEAIAELKSVTRDYPEFFPGWRYLADAYRRAGELDLASEALARCLELRPDTPETVHALALLKESQGKSSEAIALLEPLVSTYPDHLPARYLLAASLVKLGRYAEAVPHLRRVFEVDPDRTYSNLGSTVTSIANFCERSGGRNPSAMFVLAAIYAQEHRYQEAVAAAEQAKSLASRVGDHDLLAATERLISRIKTVDRGGPESSARP